MIDPIVKYFSQLYDPVPSPIQVINEAGRIVYANQAFVLLWGYKPDELKEYSVFSDSELKKSGIADKIEKVINTKTYNFIKNYSDSLLMAKDITIPILRTKIFPVTADEDLYAVLLHEDQSEIILAEAEIIKVRDGNKEAERLKNTFLNVLSHELRTPLNIILGYSSILRENMEDKVSPEDKVYLENLYSGSERLFNSISQMLEFAQIEAGNYQVNIERVNLIALLKSCIQSISGSVAEQNLDLKTNFSKQKIYVDVDYQTIEKTILNLLKNAVKFTRHGFVEVEVGILEDKGLALCKIKDSGVGISSEYMDHLFRPFSQEDREVGRNFEGNGLGLTLAKRFIEKMGGSLLVDSIKGVGSTFTFTLPLSSDTTKKTKSSLSKKQLKSILMIDDLSESYDLLNAFLKKEYSIERVNSASFKPDILKNKDYKVIIMDVNQKFWDEGLKSCKHIKEKDSHKRPVIIVSSEFMDEKIKEFYDIGADKFLIKPFSKKVITDTLTALT